MNLSTVINFWQDYLKEYTYALAIVLGFYILSRIVSRYILGFLLHLTRKTKTEYDNKLVESFRKPVAWIIICLGLYLAALYLLANPEYKTFASQLFRSAVIVFISHGLYNMVSSTSGLITKIGSVYDLDKMFLALLSKTLRGIIIALSFTVLMNEWGYDITGFIAGLGIGGLAFALAAQDTAANLFGGFVILVEKPFTIGDWIVASDVEGTVEDITFRSTKIRTFAQALVTVPNSVLAKEPITNWTRMGRRRIDFTLGISYSTPKAALERCLEKMRHMLENHPEIHPGTIFVNFEQFGKSSLDIFVYCFTNTTVWSQWLAAREDVLFKIMDILEGEGVRVAFPSRSVYIEDNKALDNKSTTQQIDTAGE